MNKTCNSTSTPPASGRTRTTQRRRPHLPRLLYGVLLQVAVLPAVMAGDSAELRVTGRVIPGPCTIALGNSGSADFGNITAAELPINGTRKLTGERALPFSIQCAPANAPRLSFKDERTDSLPALYYRTATAEGRAKMFGLGRVADKNIGMYLIHFRGIKSDGRDAKLVRSQGGEAPWQFIETGEVITKEHKYAWSTTGQPEANPFGAINGEIVVKLWPEPLDELPLQSEIKLDGSATLVLEYP